MTHPLNAITRSKRLRNALLASALTVGVAGATGAGVLFGDSPAALAEAVRVDAPAPADFSIVVEQVKPAVVSVRVKSQVEPVSDRSPTQGFRGMPDLPSDHPFNEFFRRFEGPRGFNFPDDMPGQRTPRPSMGQGSGFFVSEDGYLVTNNHVVDGAEEFTVIMDDGRELDATLVGKDERTDLAVLKVEGNDFTYVNFATEAPKVGQWVVAVGNPFGLGGTVTAGIISAEGRDIGAGPYDDFLQIDAPVNRGNSGGPTFNTRGEVVGVNTAIFSPSGGNVGIAFAIPAATVQDIVSDLRSEGSVTRGWLGVQIQPVTADIAESLGITSTQGALVSDPQEGGPGAEAGIQAGDIITQVDGKPVEGPRELARMIAQYEPDQKVLITAMRDGREQQIEVTLGTLGDQPQAARSERSDRPGPVQQGSLSGLGLTLEPASEGEGVAVTGVADGSVASEKGLQAGDVIVSIGDEPVDSVQAIEAGIESASKAGRKAVLMRVEGERGTRFVALPIEQG